jgi:hypothetical protein
MPYSAIEQGGANFIIKNSFQRVGISARPSTVRARAIESLECVGVARVVENKNESSECGLLVSTPGLATRHNWPLRRDLRKLHRLYGSNVRVSLHQITPIILLFDPLIAHSNYMVTGFKNLVSYR